MVVSVGFGLFGCVVVFGGFGAGVVLDLCVLDPSPWAGEEPPEPTVGAAFTGATAVPPVDGCAEVLVLCELLCRGFALGVVAVFVVTRAALVAVVAGACVVVLLEAAELPQPARARHAAAAIRARWRVVIRGRGGAGIGSR